VEVKIQKKGGEGRKRFVTLTKKHVGPLKEIEGNGVSLARIKDGKDDGKE